jgi:hypothetical protein
MTEGVPSALLCARAARGPSLHPSQQGATSPDPHWQGRGAAGGGRGRQPRGALEGGGERRRVSGKKSLKRAHLRWQKVTFFLFVCLGNHGLY